MSTVDVLLIYPPYTYPKKSPPIGLAYIAAVLEKEGYSVEIADMSVLGMDYKDLEKKVRQNKSKLVGISFMTNQYKEAVNISRIAKDIDSRIPVIAGGPHVSALPEEILAHESVDIAVIGEGENTVLELADELLNGNGNTAFNNLSGIAYKKGNEICINKPRQLIEDLDSLPFPAWHLLPIEKYAVPATGGDVSVPVFAIISSRGCPNNCIFCDSHTIFGRKFRARSAQNIFDELIYLNKNFGAIQFDFVDDTITVNKKRIHQLCDLILSSESKFKWMCNARANTVTLEMLQLMKKAGCVRVEFGVESGDPEVLKKMKKGIKLEQTRSAHAMARQVGLSVGSFVMVGNIGEDFSSVVKTRELLRELDTDDIFIAIATPFPGTQLYKIAKDNNWLKIRDWAAYVTSPTYFPEYQPVMETDRMNSQQIMKAFFYLHLHFVGRKIQTRYGKVFLLNKRFYKDLLNIRSTKELKHRIKLGIKLIGNRFRL